MNVMGDESLLSALALAFGAGIFGSLHCVGMCGALVLSVGRANEGSGLRAQWIYAAGRVLAYAFWGGLFGLVGSFVLLASALAELQGLVYLVAGVAVIVFATARLFGSTEPAWIHGPLGGLYKLLRRYFRPDGSRAGLFLLGMLNSLVPCGLLYTMQLRAAATGSALEGMLMLSAFGIATAPVLVVFGSLGGRLSATRRLYFDKIASGILLILGAQVLLRALSHFGWIEHSRWY
jgi:sulfite exporter TauE/SafE